VSSRRNRLIAAVVALVVVVGLVAWARWPEPEVVAAPPTTVGTTAPTTTQPTTTTTPTYSSVVAAANGPELEVFATRPDAVAPEGGAPGPGAATTASTEAPTTTAAPLKVQPIPRANLSSVGSKVTPTGWSFSNPTSFGSPLVMAATEVDGDWVKVEIPARPNSQEGWVRASDVTLSQTDYRLELTLSDFTLRVFKGNDVVVETQVVIGTDYTPTPVGTFYVGEVLTAEQARVGGPNGAYGPNILATSAYSEALELLDGGLPVIAFHGTNAPGLIGTKASNGCVRMPNEVIAQLAGMVPAGSVIIVRP
jgi:lipoprotein-anchoring transpeptidase ErfK/SrfK